MNVERLLKPLNLQPWQINRIDQLINKTPRRSATVPSENNSEQTIHNVCNYFVTTNELRDVNSNTIYGYQILNYSTPIAEKYVTLSGRLIFIVNMTKYTSDKGNYSGCTDKFQAILLGHIYANGYTDNDIVYTSTPISRYYNGSLLKFARLPEENPMLAQRILSIIPPDFTILIDPSKVIYIRTDSKAKELYEQQHKEVAV